MDMQFYESLKESIKFRHIDIVNGTNKSKCVDFICSTKEEASSFLATLECCPFDLKSKEGEDGFLVFMFEFHELRGVTFNYDVLAEFVHKKLKGKPIDSVRISYYDLDGVLQSLGWLSLGRSLKVI